MGHPVLRTVARPVAPHEIGTSWFQQLVDDLIDTMQEYQGVGLAAPQVHVSQRVFVAALGSDDESDEGEAIVLVNPEIRPASSAQIEDWEGCLSVPDLRGRVPRLEAVHVSALNRHARQIELRASGFGARVLQHEYDHLDGVLFLDRMRSFESLTFLDEYSRYWSKEQTPAE